MHQEVLCSLQQPEEPSLEGHYLIQLLHFLLQQQPTEQSKTLEEEEMRLLS